MFLTTEGSIKLGSDLVISTRVEALEDQSTIRLKGFK